jgi:N-acetylmuramoyl-L-alanine amidase
MDLDVRQLRLKSCSCIVGILLLAIVLPALARELAPEREAALADFDSAERMRQELESRSRDQRMRRDYQRVASAYRRVYYNAPTCNKADASVFAEAEVLAEEGRRFHDLKTLQSAIKQYEFLRREYPGSRYRVDALFSIAQIYRNDLGDSAQAKASFQEFLTRYPRSRMADQARTALAGLDRPQGKKSGSELRDVSVSSSDRPKKDSDLRELPVKSSLPLVTGIRHWSTPDYTRVAIDLDTEVQYQAARVADPDRIFFDLHNT